MFTSMVTYLHMKKHHEKLKEINEKNKALKKEDYEKMSKAELILRLVEKDKKIKYYRESRKGFKKMKDYTELEMKVMAAMAKDDFAREGYLNTYSDDYFSCWTDCVMDTIQEETKLSHRQIAGVFSSLSKKGVIFSNNEITNVFIKKLPSKIIKLYPKRGN